MRLDLSLLWTWDRTVGRLPYLLTGAGLLLVKYALDWAVATQVFGRPWSPLNYLIWPDENPLAILDLAPAERDFSLTMLLLSLPFIWVGVILTAHRLRSAGWPVPLLLLFFVPVVNLLLIALLVLAPPRPRAGHAFPQDLDPARLRIWRERTRRLTHDNTRLAAAFALFLSVPLTVGLVALGANVLRNYGWGLFVGSPFFLGFSSVVLFGLPRPQPLGRCALVAVGATTLAGLVVLAVAIEGLICLVMAAPIAYTLAFMGALVGYAIQARPWAGEQVPLYCFALLAVLPGLMAAESAGESEPAVRAVRTEVVIAAPPPAVWEHVLRFSPLPEPDDWFFRTGVAYPRRAEIHGTGVGAVRHCVFSTGTFVEPIEVWDAPNVLRFRVTEQPEPMEEWSPYHIHPAHLDHYLVSKQGEFRLEALPGGRTRLVGTTWYTNRMWPAAYWHLWSDYVIHRIHGRVLDHVRDLAESAG